MVRLGVCSGSSSHGDRGTDVLNLTSAVESHSVTQQAGDHTPGEGREQPARQVGCPWLYGRGGQVSPTLDVEDHVCFHHRWQKVGEQLARAAGLGEGTREALGAPAPPGREGPGPLQQRQQLRIWVPRGQPQQQRGAAAIRPRSEDAHPWDPGPRAASRGVVRGPPGQSTLPREPRRPAATETEEIF